MLTSCESPKGRGHMQRNNEAETLIGRKAVFLMGALSLSLREQAVISPICLVRRAGFVHR